MIDVNKDCRLLTNYFFTSVLHMHMHWQCVNNQWPMFLLQLSRSYVLSNNHSNMLRHWGWFTNGQLTLHFIGHIVPELSKWEWGMLTSIIQLCANKNAVFYTLRLHVVDVIFAMWNFTVFTKLCGKWRCEVQLPL